MLPNNVNIVLKINFFRNVNPQEMFCCFPFWISIGQPASYFVNYQALKKGVP